MVVHTYTKDDLEFIVNCSDFEWRLKEYLSIKDRKKLKALFDLAKTELTRFVSVGASVQSSQLHTASRCMIIIKTISKSSVLEGYEDFNPDVEQLLNSTLSAFERYNGSPLYSRMQEVCA